MSLLELKELQKEIKQIKSMLRRALPASVQEHWVGYSVIQEITPWKTGEKLRWARDNSLVKYDAKKGYLLESIPPQFINTVPTK
jgi:hypothetical protein